MAQPDIPGHPPITSPFIYTARDSAGRAITMTFNFNEGTHALLNGSATRDLGCLYSTVFVGFGVDGTVRSSTRKITVPDGGSRTLPAGELSSIGINTIDDVLSSQITAA